MDGKATFDSIFAGIEAAREYVLVQPGGEHFGMGTHNCLLKLGNALYLEVISINPAAVNPDRPRWFELDRKRSTTAARLAMWISRTNDIRAASAASPVPLGHIEAMSRGLEASRPVRREHTPSRPQAMAP